MKKMKKLAIGIGTAAILSIIGIIIAESNKSTPDWSQLWENIGISILCSLVASFVFAMIQDAVSDDMQEKVNKIQKFCEDNQKNIEKISEIDSELLDQKKLYGSGVRSIRKKSYFDQKDDFWKDIIRNTKDSLDLIGHSISRWFKNDYKDIFCSKIEEMISEGKDIRIVLSGDINIEKIKEAIKDKDKQEQLSKPEQTICILKSINVKNTDDLKHLKVYRTDKINVTYLYIKTDIQCLISPYISRENNKNSFLLEMSSGSEYARTYEDDFEEVVKHARRIQWSDFDV